MCLRSRSIASAGTARWLVRVRHPVASAPVGSCGRALIGSREQPLFAQRVVVRNGGAFKAVAVARIGQQLCRSLALRVRSAGPRAGSGAGCGALRSPAAKLHRAPGLAVEASATLWANQSVKRTPDGAAYLKR
jgi:hypothetical protein